MMKYWRSAQLWLVALVPLAATSSVFAQGRLLLSDTFSRVIGDPLNTPPQVSSWGANDNALGGTIVQTYEPSDPFTDAGNTGGAWVNGERGVLAYAHVEIDQDWATNPSVLAGGGLVVEFDLRPAAIGSGHYAWWLGTADANIDPNFLQPPPNGPGGTVPLLNTNADVGLLWRNARTTGGSFLRGVAVNNNFPINPPLSTDTNSIRIEVATTNFNSGTNASLRLFVNGNHLDINGGAAGNDLSFNWDSQGTAYMGFSKNVAVGGGGIDNLRISTLLPVSASPDFNNDGRLDCLDVDSLVNTIVNAPSNLLFDLTGDGTVNRQDLLRWLADAGAANLTPPNPYLEGDGNLDGVVDGRDFGVWNANKGNNLPAWCSGDYSADGVINNNDFAIWFANRFRSSAGAAVPECGSIAWCALTILFSLHRRRKT